MSNLRFKVLQEAFAKKAVAVQPPAGMVSDYYGSHIFGRKQMARYLSAETYRAFCDVLDNGAPFNREMANNVAVGMKNWALDMGATHYTHWFQPLTEGTAEKHDAFIEYAGQPGTDVIEEFSGKLRLGHHVAGLYGR